MPSLPDAVRDAFLESREMDASLGDRLDAFADLMRRIDPSSRVRLTGWWAACSKRKSARARPELVISCRPSICRMRTDASWPCQR